MRYLNEGVQMRNKSSSGGKTYDLVSDADLDSEKAIGEYLGNLFPHHELLGEEDLDGDVNAEHLWVIDPLDGTNNYAHEIPHFAVSIAHYHLGKPIVGVVFNPARNDLFTAAEQQGAFRNGERVRVCDSTSFAQTLVGCGFYYDRGAMMRSTLHAVEDFLHMISTVFVDLERRHWTSAMSDVGTMARSSNTSCRRGISQLGGFLWRKLGGG